MSKSVFNPEDQIGDVASKIVAGLERIAEVFKVLLWDKAKANGLSPLQIQLLIFIAYHKTALCNVSHLAKEFNVTKPTVSDAIKALMKKELIAKDFSSADSRSYSVLLTEKGKEIVGITANFANPIKEQVLLLPSEEQEALFKTLSQLIYKLNRNGILTVQRTCYGCKFYEKDNVDYCRLLEKELYAKDIRLDCPEFEVNQTNLLS
ncbi:MarR family winged helix-turn-helix transcriptional regulator [Marixanthomonas spongiae]|uniref:MarR family transcriptional regulator n=1 Tax=Marixanthomonas spongiae TaxID=2174845 RepID=A0A2U0HX19_9FLAO|nr:MarR family winged helix-turn-helix transcriptional regulator [Marixanthomonas spongiae]PVW13387.1 MarR family transcriptional regulator [Marixanthomonas spongiae]